MQTSPEYEWLKAEIAKAKAANTKVFRSRIWNQYRFEYLALLAKQDGITLIETKRDVKDNVSFEINL